MKTEYLYTPEQKAELADIDRQIAELCRRKVDIQLMARVRYIPDMREEIEAVYRMTQYVNAGLGIPKEMYTIKILGDWKND